MIKFSPLSSLMLLVLLVVFIVCVVTDIVKYHTLSLGISPDTLVRYGANTNIFGNFEAWRLIFAMFLHAGFVHILMNGLAFLAFLMPVEAKVRNHLIFAFVLFFGGMYIWVNIGWETCSAFA